MFPSVCRPWWQCNWSQNRTSFMLLLDIKCFPSMSTFHVSKHVVVFKRLLQIKYGISGCGPQFGPFLATFWGTEVPNPVEDNSGWGEFPGAALQACISGPHRALSSLQCMPPPTRPSSHPTQPHPPPLPHPPTPPPSSTVDYPEIL